MASCPAPYFSDSSALQCVLSCPLDQLTYADSVLRQCVTYCNNHTVNTVFTIFYADNASMSCVQQCPELPTKFYGYNQSNVCLENCPVSTWGFNNTRVCLDICVF